MNDDIINWTKFLVNKVKAAYRIRAIAGNLNAELPTNFELEDLVDLPTELMKKIVVKLVETKCTRLTRDGWEMRVLLLPAFRIYLATRPRKVDLTPILSFSPTRLKYQVLKTLVLYISGIAADIEELSLDASSRFFLSFSAIADAELLKSLGKLTRLRVLRFEEICKVRLIDLIELCQNLPDLEFLHFTVSDLLQLDIESDRILEQMKSAMPKLKVFIHGANVGERNITLIRCLAENLPNLHVIQSFASTFSSSEDYESSNEIPRASGSSNLRHLKVEYNVDKDCTNLPTAYPLVTHLWVSINYFFHLIVKFRFFSKILP
ncbi:Hypothetical predicted protein [Cloeon dipterum]|uniref:F-box domain-containing protein n=1 Tax=Cloeon dipterum TaxID=197152 RepID=A0A8S1CL29_9INSE|nr:Hypothetical predicted protein [Cloeon dipterum]